MMRVYNYILKIQFVNTVREEMSEKNEPFEK